MNNEKIFMKSCFDLLDLFQEIGIENISNAVSIVAYTNDIPEQQAWEIYKEWKRIRKMNMAGNTRTYGRRSYPHLNLVLQHQTPITLLGCFRGFSFC